MIDPNAQTNGLYFHLSDLYPGTSFNTTSTDVQPEAEDQTALVDDQSIAAVSAADPKAKFNIFLALGILLAVAIMMGVAD
jgi:hypothetical protein